MTRPDSFDWIMGRNTLEELLKFSPERILEVWTTQVFYQNKRKEDILEKIEKIRIPIKTASKDKLTQIVGSDSHQSFIAKVKRRPFHSIQSLLKKQKEKTLYIALDSIFDPQNFGAILRVAECFCVDGIIFSKNRGCDITPIVSKTSCGASEFLPMALVSNLATTLLDLQKEDFEVIVADIGDDCVDLPSFNFPDKCVLVLGSEGKGIQPLIKKRADHHVTIPMEGKISSLNVAQSSAVLLYLWRFGNNNRPL